MPQWMIFVFLSFFSLLFLFYFLLGINCWVWWFSSLNFTKNPLVERPLQHYHHINHLLLTLYSFLPSPSRVTSRFFSYSISTLLMRFSYNFSFCQIKFIPYILFYQHGSYFLLFKGYPSCEWQLFLLFRVIYLVSVFLVNYQEVTRI